MRHLVRDLNDLLCMGGQRGESSARACRPTRPMLSKLVSASRGGVLTLFKAVQWVRSEGIGSTGGSRTAFRSSGSEKASARVFVMPGIASATAFIPGTASKGFLPSLPGIIDIRLVIQTTTRSIRICPTTLRFTHGISFKYTGTSFTLLSTFIDEKDFDGLAPP
ncbi:hypothetical protein JOM56_015002 [Amanita muscaria]